MDHLTISVILLAVLTVALMMGLWIGLALLLVGGLAIAAFTNPSVGQVAATSIWGHSAEWSLTALPMFIWMGEILFRTRLSENMFNGLGPWLTWLPGRLLHVNVAGCAIFSAVSGSSTATCATVARVALPELARRGYPEHLSLGSLASAGTLGILIPPSVIMVVYAVAAEVSIIQLFIAGLLPGLLIAALFSAWIVAWSIANPSRIPPDDMGSSWAIKFGALKKLLPVLLLIAGVIGGLFSGTATATEVGALGVAGAFVIAWFTGTLTRENFSRSAFEAMRTTAMIGVILMGSHVLAASMALTGIPKALAEWVATMQFSPYTLIAMLVVVYLLLGTALEGVAMILLTTSIVLPLVKQAGFDPVWFGVFIVIMTELATLSPPVGFNLFVLQAMSGKDSMSIARSTAPFFLLLVIATALMTVFPEIVTWLPKAVMSKN